MIGSGTVRRAATVAATAALAMCVIIPTGHVDAATGSKAALDAPLATIAITSISPTTLSGPETVTIAGTVTNTSPSPMTGDLNLRIDTKSLTSEADVLAWTSASLLTLKPSQTRIVRVDVIHTPIAPHQTIPFTFAVPPSAMPELTRGMGWGPHGIMVEMETNIRSVGSAQSFIVYAPAHAITTTTHLTVAAPLVAQPKENVADTLDRAEKIVSATANSAVDWILDPSILGTPKPATQTEPTTSATPSQTPSQTNPAGATVEDNIDTASQSTAQKQLSSQIESALGNRSVYTLPFTDPNVSLLTANPTAGSTLLGVAAQQSGLVLSANAATTHLAKTAQPTNLLWPNTQADSSSLSLASAENKNTTVLITNSENFLNRSKITAPAAVYSLQSGGNAQNNATNTVAFVSDAALSKALATPQSNTSDVQLVVALLAAAGTQTQRSGSTGSLLAVLPRSWNPDSETKKTLSLIDSLPWITPTSMASMGTSAPTATATLPAAQTPTQGPSAAHIGALADYATRLLALAEATDDSAAASAQLLSPIFQPFLLASTSSFSVRDSQASLAAAQAQKALAGVSIVSQADINLIATSGQVPINILNTSGRTLHLKLSVVRADRSIRVNTTSALLKPMESGVQVTARIPVQAITNGTAQFVVVLTNPQGQAISEPTTFTLRVRAEWENVGTGVAAILFVIIFILGMYRTLRKRRRNPRFPGSAAREVTPSRQKETTDE